MARTGTIKAKIEVDTAELDKAIEKIKEAHSIATCKICGREFPIDALPVEVEDDSLDQG